MAEPIAFTFSDTLSAGLNAALARAHDFTPAMRSIAALMEEAAQLRFETQSGPDGTPWLPSRRAAAVKGGKTLFKSGKLLGSLTSAFDATSAQAGTNVVYAAIHQTGGTIRGKTRPDRTTAPLRTPFGPRASVTIPARPFLGFSVEDVGGIEGILTSHLAGVAA